MIFYLRVKPNVDGTSLITPKEYFKSNAIAAVNLAMESVGDRNCLYEITCADATARDAIVSGVQVTWTAALRTQAEALADAESYTGAAWGISGAEQIKPQRVLDLETNLPAWATVSTAIDNIANLADAKAFLQKLSRVVYWLAKETET